MIKSLFMLMAIGSTGPAVLKVKVDSRDAEKGIDNLKSKTDGIQSVAGGAAVAMGLLVGAFKQLLDLAERGDRLNDMYARLKINIDLASQALQGQKTQAQLVEEANRLTAANIHITGEEFANLERFAAQYAETTGTTAVEAMAKLEEALISGREKGFHKLGLEAKTTEEAIREAGQAGRDAALDFTGAGDQVERLKNMWVDFTDKVARAVDGSGSMGLLLTTLGNIIRSFNDLRTSIGNVLSSIAELTGNTRGFEALKTIMSGLKPVLMPIVALFNMIDVGIKAVAINIQHLASLNLANILDPRNFQENARKIGEALRAAMVESGQYTNATLARFNAMALQADNAGAGAGGTSAEETPTGGGGGRGGRRQGSSWAFQAESELERMKRIDAEWQAQDRMQSRSRWAAVRDTEASEQRKLQLKQEAFDWTMRAMTREDAAEQRKAERFNRRYQGMGQTLGQFTQAIASTTAAMAAQGATFEDIGSALLKILLQQVAQIAFVEMAKNIAWGISSLARGVASYGADVGADASAPMFFASAAGWAALGGLSTFAAESVGGGASKGGGGGKGAGVYGGNGASVGSGGAGGGQAQNTYYITVNGAVDKSGTAREFEKIIKHGKSMGFSY